MCMSYPRMTHPLVRISATGRPEFGRHAVAIAAWSREEDAQRLDELYRFATQSKYIYSLHVGAGRRVGWDNRCTMHRGTPFKRHRYERDRRGTTISGYGPEGSALEPARASA